MKYAISVCTKKNEITLEMNKLNILNIAKTQMYIEGM